MLLAAKTEAHRKLNRWGRYGEVMSPCGWDGAEVAQQVDFPAFETMRRENVLGNGCTASRPTDIRPRINTASEQVQSVG